MKTLNESFEDKEFEDLTKAKKDKSWHDFIMLLTNKQIMNLSKGISNKEPKLRLK